MTYFRYQRIFKGMWFFAGVFVVGIILFAPSAIEKHERYGIDKIEAINEGLWDALQSSFVVSIIFSIGYILTGSEKKKEKLATNGSPSKETSAGENLIERHISNLNTEYENSIQLKLEIENIKKTYPFKVSNEQARIIAKYAREHSISTYNEDDKHLKELLTSEQIKIPIIEKYFSNYKDNKDQTISFETYLISVLANNTEMESLVAEEQLDQQVEPTYKPKKTVSDAILPETTAPLSQEEIYKRLLLFITYLSTIFIAFYKVALAIDESHSYYNGQMWVHPVKSGFNLYYSWWVWIAYIIIVAIGANFIFNLKITLRDFKNKRN